MPGSADLCFLTDTKVENVLKALEEAKIDVLEGNKVVERTGAVGKIRSVYVRDPDGNLIEYVFNIYIMTWLIWTINYGRISNYC